MRYKIIFGAHAPYPRLVGYIELYRLSRKEIKMTCHQNPTRQWKSDESTKHYLIQMLLAINWRYWQAEKYSRMLKKVQGRLIQVHFVETHKDFRKNRSDSFLTE